MLLKNNSSEVIFTKGTLKFLNKVNLRMVIHIMRLVIIIGYFALVGLDVCIQFDAYFISKPFWKPPLLSGLVVAIACLLILYAVNQILGILALYPQLLLTLIPLIVKVAYNLWIRRRKPEYIVVMERAI